LQSRVNRAHLKRERRLTKTSGDPVREDVDQKGSSQLSEGKGGPKGGTPDAIFFHHKEKGKVKKTCITKKSCLFYGHAPWNRGLEGKERRPGGKPLIKDDGSQSEERGGFNSNILK